MTYTVNLWGSSPGTNDDCETGADFETLAEARACYDNPAPHFYAGAVPRAAWFELDGPDIHEERRNPAFVPTRDDDSDWRREIATQAGMAGGCDAYNDAMGWA